MAETTYRQITHRLDFYKGVGKDRVRVVSERPRDQPTGRYLDDDAPTLVTIDDSCDVDVDWLLKLGAIEPLPAPVRRSAKAAPTEGTHGQSE